MNDRERIGEVFVGHLAAREFDRLEACLAGDVRLRTLTPSGPGEVLGAAEVRRRFEGWFGDAVEFEVLEWRARALADRLCLSYQARVRRDGALELVQQQCCCDAGDGLLRTIDLLCSGFRPLEAHRFDAGQLGCADGLASEFRRRIQAIQPGELLTVTAGDPVARQELPALCRLLGHRVRTVGTLDDGRLTITVERGR